MDPSLQEELMAAAIEVSKAGVAAGQSPFGAVIAGASGEIVCATHNTVRATCDPTAHAEVNAIRASCRHMGVIDLSGHVMATTCEPCPMCAAAIHWARLDGVIIGASIEDAEQAGFNELALPCTTVFESGQRRVTVLGSALRKECTELFNLWKEGPNPTPY